MFVLKVTWEIQLDVFVCFIGNHKACDRVNRNEVIHNLDDLNADDKAGSNPWVCSKIRKLGLGRDSEQFMSEKGVAANV